MNSKTKQALIITAIALTVIGVGYLAWRQWGGGEPMFGKGKVDKQAKQSRRMNFFKTN